MLNHRIPIAACMIALLTSFAPTMALPQATKEPLTQEDVRKEAAELRDVMQRYSMQQREEAVRSAREALTKTDERIRESEDEVRRAWNTLSEAAQQRVRAEMESLRQTRLQVEERATALEQNTSAAWSELRNGFVDAYAILQTAVRDARAELRKQEE